MSTESNTMWIAMTFDPKLSVDPKEIVEALLGNRRMTADQWEDTKECAADLIRQLIAIKEQDDG